MIATSASRVIRALVCLFSFISLAGAARAQTATIKSIVPTGDLVTGGLLASDGNIYSTSPINVGFIEVEDDCNNGNSSCTYITKLTPDGKASILHTFERPDDYNNPVTIGGDARIEGTGPNPLIEGTDGFLYGTCVTGGSSNAGTLFKISKDGVFTLLYAFPEDSIQGVRNGIRPGPLVEAADGNFYGTAWSGGPTSADGSQGGQGVLFKATPTGVVTVIKTFFSGPTGGTVGNPEGASPLSLVQASDGNFYGTTLYSRTNTADHIHTIMDGYGTLFSVTPDGTYTLLHNFAIDGSEGVNPLGPLVEGPDGNLYGSNNAYNVQGAPQVDALPNKFYGNIYRTSLGGSFQVVHTFTGGADGSHPDNHPFFGGDGNLYDSTRFGGSTTACTEAGGCGLVFQMTPSGTKNTIYAFTGSPDSALPIGPMVQLNDGSLFGTTFGDLLNANPTGGIAYTLNTIPAFKAHIQLTFSQGGTPIDTTVTTVAPNTPLTLTWNVLNAYSATARVCHASIQGSPSGAGIWTGKLTGTATSTGYGGTATITPTSSGLFTYSVTCGGRESGFITLAVNGPIDITSTTLPETAVGTPYSTTLLAQGGTPPYTWSIDSVTSNVTFKATSPSATSTSLPEGLTLNPTTGVISGTPAQFGDYTIAVTATDSAAQQAHHAAAVALKIDNSLLLKTPSLPKATALATYKQTLKVKGGVEPYTFSVLSGALPDGLALDSLTGIISGKPKAPGNTILTIQVADKEARPAKDTVTYTIKVVPTVEIASVEFTQVIQQYQPLDDLKATLTATSEPPVPIVTNKPAVMRVYFTAVDDATPVTLTITGAPVSNPLSITIQPNCAPEDQRSHANTCPSQDIYFTPPTGSWNTTLTLTNSSGTQIEQETLNLKSRDTQALNLKGLWVCSNPAATVSCQSPANLSSLVGFISQVMPTSSVSTTATATHVTVPLYAADRTTVNTWLDDVLTKIFALYTAADATADSGSKTRTTYMGVYSGEISSTGVAFNPSHAALVPSVADRLGIESANTIMAHETGHTLGLPHTGKVAPAAANNVAPGCWGAGQVSLAEAANWPYADNKIQSTAGLEWGFNVATKTPIDPDKTYDVMSYCVPRWITPISYKRMFPGLGGSEVLSPSISTPTRIINDLPSPAATPTLLQGNYVNVSGKILPSGVTFAPLFTEPLLGSPDPGTGTYALQLLDASGNILFTRNTTPSIAETDTLDTDIVGSPTFSDWLPVTPNMASVVLRDPTNVTLTTLSLAGSAPTVAFTSPTSGFSPTGVQTISWSVSNTNASTLTSKLEYSTDNGATFFEIGRATNVTSYTLDFSTLPGASSVLLKVLVSDGLHTGSATSIPLNVPRKLPAAVIILTPTTGSSQRSTDAVYLTGSVYDTEDGYLTGSQLKWSSDLQGALGVGSPLSLKLQPGKHTITLTGTDTDGNAVKATTQINIGGGAPTISIATSSTPVNCVTAMISATSGSQGADLTAVNYSLNGGVTYTAIPLTQLPFSLPIPGSGDINLVATVYDLSGQSNAASTHIILPSACAPGSKSTPTVTWTTPASITYGTALTTVQLNATASVPGTFAYSPTLGNVLPAGSQTLSVTFTPTDTNSYNTATATITLNVIQASTITTAKLSAPTITAGTAETITITVAAANSGIPTGTVTILDGTTSLGTAPLVSGVASFTPSTLTTGTHALNLSYPGDNNFTASATTATVTVTAVSTPVTPAPTTITAKLSAASITAGSTETMTVTVAAASGTPTGTVTILDGASPLGTALLSGGTGTFTTSSLTSGAHTLNINYPGDANFAASSTTATLTVTAVTTPPNTDFTFTASGTTTQTVGAGQPATYNFMLTPPTGGFPAAVTFAVTGLPIGATATFTPSSLAVGSATQTVVLTVQTAAHARRNQGPLDRTHSVSGATPFILAFVPLPLLFLRRLGRWGANRRHFGLLFLNMIIGLGLSVCLAGCASSTATSAIPQSSTLTVTATSGTNQHTITLILTTN